MAASVFVYEGEYNAAGQREGYGTMRFADGTVYEGCLFIHISEPTRRRH